VSELEEKEHFNEQLMKKISGGDDISIRACGSDKNVTVKLNSVLMLALNEVPKFNESAFAGRMRVLAFKTKFQNNPEKREAILSKIDDFFSVACHYAKKYYQQGMKFEDVEEVLQSTREVVDERDTFKTWLGEDNYLIDITKDEPAWRVKATSVYANYIGWCVSNKVEGIGRSKFYSRFRDEYKLPEYNQGKYWCGLKERGFGDV
jgi:phage/plasmid-associated DNA primase